MARSDVKFEDLKTLANIERPGKEGYRSEFVKVILSELPANGEFKARRMASVRLWFTAEDNSVRPTQKGIVLRQGEIEEVIRALQEALKLSQLATDEILNGPAADSNDKDIPF